MKLQEELKALKERIAELEEQVKEEKEFPKYGDVYWLINATGETNWIKWHDTEIDNKLLSIGNIYKTTEQAEFAVEKLKVEAELRKFGRPFKYNVSNYCIELCLPENSISVFGSGLFKTQGVIYFESKDEAYQAIETVGEQRIKKYIFGLED